VKSEVVAVTVTTIQVGRQEEERRSEKKRGKIK
jgi:hypothetical protein